MFEIFKHILDYFRDGSMSISSKIYGFIAIILLFIAIDHFVGFSFYFSKGQKISLLKEIEELKSMNIQNTKLISTLNQDENEIIERKNIAVKFLELFSNESMDSKPKSDLGTILCPQSIDGYQPNNSGTIKNQSDTSLVFKPYTIHLGSLDSSKYNSSNFINSSQLPNNQKVITQTNEKHQIQPKFKSRSQFWHTITSSFFLIVLMVGTFLVPFNEKQFNWSTIVTVIFMVGALAFFVWLFQYVLGLIPIIFNKPWINYILNFIIQSFILLFFGLILTFGKKKSKP